MATTTTEKDAGATKDAKARKDTTKGKTTPKKPRTAPEPEMPEDIWGQIPSQNAARGAQEGERRHGKGNSRTKRKTPQNGKISAV